VSRLDLREIQDAGHRDVGDLRSRAARDNRGRNEGSHNDSERMMRGVFLGYVTYENM
jgi:hypothetical protein